MNDLIPILSKSGFKISRQAILKVLRDEWELEPAGNTLAYTKYTMINDGTMVTSEAKGRYYTINRKRMTLKKTWKISQFDDSIRGK